ncbi:MAG: glycoside hydrolase family 127 protein [Opitutaceae bacterium]|nr:glycoside hydrolase family 127 protein [Opitutaceae bacterium]
MLYPSPGRITLDGLLGSALAASKSAHLLRFIRDEHSSPMRLFCPEHRQHNSEGDWYGEHAGKWLCSAALAVERTGDDELRSNLRRVADFLVGVQEKDGYLGTYTPGRRFMCTQGPAPRTWDGAPAQRTWDIWIHSYLILGLLEAARVLSQSEYLSAARRIGDLCWRTIARDGINITTLGNHQGLSATVLLDPAVELYRATGEPHYLELAELIVRQASLSPALELLPQILSGLDLAYVATGKAYQLCWNLVGLAKLHRVTGKPEYLQAVKLAWNSIRNHHLTLGGGPWGGVAHRSREVFNPPGVFSPYGYVETCSTFSWIQLNRELLGITGAAEYAEEIEKSAYNDLLGAQSPAGDNWCYYSFPNGRRVFTTYWRCCKSSGPWALEELPSLAYGTLPTGDVSVNLYGPGQATIESTAAGRVELAQETLYPWDGLIRIRLQPEREARWGLNLRIPSWAVGAHLEVNGKLDFTPLATGTYARIERTWTKGDTVSLHLPMIPRLHRQLNRNVQESRAPDGSPVAQEVLRFEYAAITCGPLVYSTELIDGFKIEETVRLPDPGSPLMLKLGDSPPGGGPRPVMLHLDYRPPITFLPYYLAGGQRDGTWRLTWLQLAPEEVGS